MITTGTTPCFCRTRKQKQSVSRSSSLLFFSKHAFRPPLTFVLQHRALDAKRGGVKRARCDNYMLGGRCGTAAALRCVAVKGGQFRKEEKQTIGPRLSLVTDAMRCAHNRGRQVRPTRDILRECNDIAQHINTLPPSCVSVTITCSATFP